MLKLSKKPVTIILDLFAIVNLIYIFLFIATIPLSFIDIERYRKLVFEDSGSSQTLMSLCALVIWIYSLYKWSKRDKRIGTLLLLFFLIGIYAPFYYWKRIRKDNLSYL